RSSDLVPQQTPVRQLPPNGTPPRRRRQTYHLGFAYYVDGTVRSFRVGATPTPRPPPPATFRADQPLLSRDPPRRRCRLGGACCHGPRRRTRAGRVVRRGAGSRADYAATVVARGAANGRGEAGWSPRRRGVEGSGGRIQLRPAHSGRGG